MAEYINANDDNKTSSVIAVPDASMMPPMQQHRSVHKRIEPFWPGLKKELEKITPENLMKSLKYLVIAQIVCASAMSHVGFLCFVGRDRYEYRHEHRGVCEYGTGFWINIFFLIIGGVGLRAVLIGYERGRRTLIGYFVLSVISSTLVFVLCVIPMAASLSDIVRDDWYMGLNAIMGFGSLVFGITSIVSTSMICSLWCNQANQPSTTVLYIGSTLNNTNDESGQQPQQVTVVTEGQTTFEANEKLQM